jgi:hypothetical protein
MLMSPCQKPAPQQEELSPAPMWSPGTELGLSPMSGCSMRPGSAASTPMTDWPGGQPGLGSADAGSNLLSESPGSAMQSGFPNSASAHSPPCPTVSEWACSDSEKPASQHMPGSRRQQHQEDEELWSLPGSPLEEAVLQSPGRSSPVGNNGSGSSFDLGSCPSPAGEDSPSLQPLPQQYSGSPAGEKSPCLQSQQQLEQHHSSPDGDAEVPSPGNAFGAAAGTAAAASSPASIERHITLRRPPPHQQQRQQQEQDGVVAGRGIGKGKTIEEWTDDDSDDGLPTPPGAQQSLPLLQFPVRCCTSPHILCPIRSMLAQATRY